MKTLKTYLSISLLIISFSALCQQRETDPGWQWARLSNISNAFNSEKILTDADNNFISFFYYNDSVIIEDTAFYHIENYSGDNFVIVKRNSEGELIKAVDIYTNPGEFLFRTDMETDNESNIYVCGSFSDTLYVNDTMITMPRPGIDIYLFKLDKNLEFLWGGTISSVYQDDCEEMAVSEDNYIYLSTDHSNSVDTSHYFVNYFDQDSADVSEGLNSLIKMSPDGQIVWRAEIRDEYDGFTEIINTISGSDGNIYLIGHATNDLYIQGDTVEFPSSPEYYMPGFIVQFDPDGMHHDAFFIPYLQFGFYIPETNIDADGNYIIAEEISETMIFGSDTIKLTNDSAYAMVAKFDPSFQPLWQRGIKTTGSTYPSFQIELINDSIAFAFQGASRFEFMGQDYVLNAIGQIFSGIFSPDGELAELQATDATIGAKLHSFTLDNCNNLLMDGIVRGLAHFGNDTLNSGYANLDFLAKNAHIQPFSINMPFDTAGCGSLALYAPAGYDHYWWNGILTGQNWLLVTNTDVINLKVSTDNCIWSEASTVVTIWPSFSFSLGNDTTILLTDTLNLGAVPGYEAYLWSTGETGPSLSLPANQLQIGINVIWLEITNGPCFSSDTIIVNVIDNSFIGENPASEIIIVPNPAKTSFRILNGPANESLHVKIFNQQGILVSEFTPTGNNVDISDLEPGIYIVELFFGDNMIRKKLVIN